MIAAFLLAFPALFSRLSAFILLCSGVQVFLAGVADALGPLPVRR